MDQNYEIPVFLIDGFLDSGKTTFIAATIDQGQFDEAKKKLLIVCEEGEAEYDKAMLSKHRMDMVVLEKEEFTAERLEQLDKQYDPWLVVIEYNGMWENALLDELKKPFGWTVYQRITLVNAATFELMWNNMKSTMAETMRLAEMVIFNRCEQGMPLGSFRRSIRALNGAAQIVFENTNGEIASIAEQLPYDINADVIEVEDADYGIWYMDVSERPEVYKDKKVRFRGQVYKGKKFSGKSFVPGRKAMTCCEADTAFIGYVCNYKDADRLEERSWVWVEATIKYEFQMSYRKKGPVLYAVNVTPAEAAAEEMVTF
jgi:uncharacterized repeat protein (TIGR03943 family)